MKGFRIGEALRLTFNDPSYFQSENEPISLIHYFYRIYSLEWELYYETLTLEKDEEGWYKSLK